MIHHLGFKKHGQRRIASYAHIWIGRIFISLGMINGGLGFQLSANVQRGTYIAYGSVAGIVWLSWLLVAVLSESRRLSNVPTTKRMGRDSHKEGGQNSRRRDLSQEDERTATYALKDIS
jgi:hypothetical protein